jgi:DeoR/GlpR family transcriptional regulator of sugar metabolism
MAQHDTLSESFDKRKVMSISDLVRLLGDDHETIRRKLITGEIPGGFQIGKGSKWKVRRSIVEKWWEAQGK